MQYLIPTIILSLGAVFSWKVTPAQVRSAHPFRTIIFGLCAALVPILIVSMSAGNFAVKTEKLPLTMQKGKGFYVDYGSAGQSLVQVAGEKAPRPVTIKPYHRLHKGDIATLEVRTKGTLSWWPSWLTWTDSALLDPYITTPNQDPEVIELRSLKERIDQLTADVSYSFKLGLNNQQNDALRQEQTQLMWIYNRLAKTIDRDILQSRGLPDTL